MNRPAGKILQRRDNKALVITAFLALILCSGSVCPTEILVIGDSWSEPMRNPLQNILHENGHVEMNVEFASPRWFAAKDLNTPEAFQSVSDWLATYPDTRFIHLSTGDSRLWPQKTAIAHLHCFTGCTRFSCC